MLNLNFTFCHQKPERSFFWRDIQFPMCARCTGIYVGYLVLPLFLFDLIRIPLLWTILLIVPTYLDGSLQAYLGIKSNNTRRFITGIISGIGSMSLVSIIGIYIGKQILLLIH